MAKEIDLAASTLRPGLAPACKLYYDASHKRWVMRGPNQVVFPDADSLQVLLLCNGERSVSQISRKLSTDSDETAHDQDSSVFDIVTRFLKRGFLAPSTSGAAFPG